MSRILAATSIVILAACATVDPIVVAQPSPALAERKIVLPPQVLISGPDARLALSAEPDLAAHARAELAASLTEAGYAVIEEAETASDLRLALTLNATEVRASVMTLGRYGCVEGSLAVADGDGLLVTLTAGSHPEDAGGYFARYYPTVGEATTRVLRGLVSSIAGAPELAAAVDAGAQGEAEESTRTVVEDDAEAGAVAPDVGSQETGGDADEP